MERSDQVGDLITALAKAQADFGHATKTTTNSAFGSKYADLAANIDAVRPALNKHGIALLQFPEVDLELQTVSVETALLHGEQFISQKFIAPAVGRQGFNVQSIGMATTYLRRYGLQALCGLASEDDDGNSVATENKPIAKAKTEEKKPSGPTDADFQMWLEAFQECPTIEEWNKLIVPMMKERADHPQYGRQFIVAAAEEAKRRGYVGDRTTGAYKLKNPLPPKKEPTVEEYEQGYAERQAVGPFSPHSDERNEWAEAGKK
jgi:hypothetical protein